MGNRNMLIAALAGYALFAPGCAVEGEDMEMQEDDTPVPPDDEPEQPQGCDVDFGRSYIMERFEIPGDTVGADHNGDGVVDNALSFLGVYANQGWRESISSGAMMYMIDITPWMDDMSITSTDVGLAFYQGLDIDGDPSNNTSGGGHFLVSAEQFDVSCNPTSAFHDVVLENTRITATRDTWSFYLPDYGTLEFNDISGVVEVAPDLSSVHTVAGAVWTYCSLSRAPFPGPFPGTFLDMLVTVSNAVPDVDRDGDGIERVISDGQSVVRCIDGDGTEIVDPFCACDPRIADGFSIAFEGWAVPAVIEGITATQH